MAVRVRAGVGGTAAVVKCSAPTPRLCDTQHATRERGARRGARAAPVALQLFGFREGGGESRKRGAQVHRTKRSKGSRSPASGSAARNTSLCEDIRRV